jgi:hypothetical protein
MIIKCKIFESRNVKGDDSLENIINDWLSERPHIEVVNILQSETADASRRNLTVTIFYMPSVVGKRVTD